MPRVADPRQALQHRRAAGGAAAPGRKRAGRRRPLSGLPGAAARGDCRRSQGLAAGAPLLGEHFSVERAVDLALRLDHSTLAMQGPPGTGKTYTGAQIAVALMRAGPAGRRDRAQPQGDPQPARGDRAGGARRRASASAATSAATATTPTSHRSATTAMIENVGNAECEAPDDDVLLMAGTSWLFARPGLEGVIDTLLIDEAGQVSLADALAVGTCATNLILLGDPQQLAQVAQGGHPEQTAVSALGHLLGERAHDAGRARAVHRRQPAHAPRRLPLRQRDQLRRRAAPASTECGSQAVDLERPVRRRPARLPRRARRQPPRLPRGGRGDRRAGRSCSTAARSPAPTAASSRSAMPA